MIKLLANYSKIFITLCVLISAIQTKAQLLDSPSLDTVTAFTNLTEALKNPNMVVKLILRKQHLKTFPLQILLFKNLQYLDISKNSITEIPDSIGTLTQLQYFACSKTGLQKVSKNIGKLVELKYLNLNQNDLEYLPPQIGNLQKLEILDIWSNNFNEYPENFKMLTALKIIDLRNILISEDEQTRLKALMPKATVYMSPSCRCKW